MLACNFSTLLGIKKVIVDGGYSGANFADFVKTIYAAEVEVVKRNEFHKFTVLPKRWIVERSFGWLDKNRRLWMRKLHTSMQFTVFLLLFLFYSKDFRHALRINNRSFLHGHEKACIQPT